VTARRGNLWASIAILVIGCSDGPTGDSSIGPPAVVQVISGDRQRAQVTATLPAPLVVEVLDARGRPVGGERVTFAATTGGALSPVEPVTNSEGQARTTYTIGPVAGEQRVTATVATLTPITFTLFADPGAASSVEAETGDGQTGTVATALAEPIVVVVRDAHGNPIPDASVGFVLAVGSVDPAVAVTDATGAASTTWTLGTGAGRQTLEARTGSLSTAVTATATAAAAAHVEFVAGGGQQGTRGSELPWPLVTLVTDAYGNPRGEATVTFQVSGDGAASPSNGVTDPTGRVSVTWRLGSQLGRQTATATVGGVGVATADAQAVVPLVVLDHVAIDAAYDSVGDRVLTVSAGPDRLNVIDPVSGAVTVIVLNLVPTAVTVQPDGRYAAVGHNGFISYVNLSTGIVERVYGVTTDVLSLVLPGNGWVYAFPRIDQWESIRSVELGTGNETSSGQIYAGTLARLHPSGAFIYGADNGLSPSDFEKFDIRSGVAVVMYDSPYHGDFSFGGNLWMYETGTRIVARSGNVFSASSVQAQDLLYAGSIGGQWPVAWAAHSAGRQRVLVLRGAGYNSAPPSELQSYSDAFLAYQGSVQLPAYTETDASGTTAYASEGRFVFASRGGSRVYVLVRGQPPYVGRFTTGLAVFEGSDIP